MTDTGQFPSILFAAGFPADLDRAQAPDCFPDLNLDQVVEAVARSRPEHALAPLSGVWSDVAVTSSTRLSGSEVFLVDVVIWGRPSSCSAPVTAPGSTPVVARGRVPVVSGVAGSRR